MVEVEKPSFKITDGLAEMVVVDVDAAPGVTLNELLVPVSEPEELVAVIEQEPTLETDTVLFIGDISRRSSGNNELS